MVCVPSSSSNISSHQVSLTLGLSWWENSSPNIFDTSLCGRTLRHIQNMQNVSPSQPEPNRCHLRISSKCLNMLSSYFHDISVLYWWESFKLKLYKVNRATKGDQCKPDRFLKRIWIDYPRFFLNKYMDGRKNVSISHILPGGRYASAVHSWISTLTGEAWSRYIFSFCFSRRFFCSIFLCPGWGHTQYPHVAQWSLLIAAQSSRPSCVIPCGQACQSSEMGR